jgi:branched-chain amino acid transport system ATP-binding protein
MLQLHDVHAHYGSAHVLQGVSLEVQAGQIVCLIGRNGAGKSTTLKSVMGMVRTTAGSIVFKGERIDGQPPHNISARGLAWVPEDRRCFASLSVQENIAVAAQAKPGASAARIAQALAFFSDLEARASQRAGSLSGGQQQMLTIARALASEPDLIMLDEPTEGLSPIMVDTIRKGILDSRARGLSILLVEQNIALALAVGEVFYVMSRGTIVHRATQQELTARPELIREHLGVAITTSRSKSGARNGALDDPSLAALAVGDIAIPAVPHVPEAVEASTQIDPPHAPTPELLRRVFGMFATGVTVIGARSAEGCLVGMTANSFTSVSLNPPLVLFCVAKSQLAFQVYAAAAHFSVSILAQEAKPMSRQFALSGAEKWSTVAHSLGDNGLPLLTGALATMQCQTVARHDGGDHLIVVGHVLQLSHRDEAEPLLFFGSRYRRLDPQVPNQEMEGDVSFLIWG